jgi:hypothetical protein
MSARKIALTATIETTTAAIAKLDEKRATLLAKIEDALAELSIFDAIAAVGKDSVVYIVVGRGDTRREVEAVVRAVKDKTDAEGNVVEGVKVLKVEYTSAFTPGFTGRIAFTPEAFSNDFAVIESTSILGVKPVVAEPVDEDAELEARIAEAESEHQVA